MEYDVPYTANAIMEALHLKSKETFRKKLYQACHRVGISKNDIAGKAK